VLKLLYYINITLYPDTSLLVVASWRPFFSRCPQNTKAANAAEIVSLSK